jgi:hypothetical protein
VIAGAPHIFGQVRAVRLVDALDEAATRAQKSKGLDISIGESAILPVHSRGWREILAAASPGEIHAAIEDLRLKRPGSCGLDRLLDSANRHRILRLEDLATVPMRDDLRLRLANIEAPVREYVARDCDQLDLIETIQTVVHRPASGGVRFDILPPPTCGGDFEGIFEDSARSRKFSRRYFERWK